jgi:hypothetical protein
MTRMVSTDETTAAAVTATAVTATAMTATALTAADTTAPVWTDAPPVEVARVAGSLASAFHMSEWGEGLDYEHRIRIYDDILESLADSSSAAARAGFATWALAVIDAAAMRPPAWAGGHAGGFWEQLLASGRDAVLSTLAA